MAVRSRSSSLQSVMTEIYSRSDRKPVAFRGLSASGQHPVCTMAQRPSQSKIKDFCQLSHRESQVPFLAVCANWNISPFRIRLACRRATFPPGEGLRRAAAGNDGTGTRAIVQHLWGSPGSIHEGETDCTTGIPFGHHASVRTYLAMTTEIRKLLHWSTDSPRPGLRRDTPPHKCGGQVYTQERYRAGEGQ